MQKSHGITFDLYSVRERRGFPLIMVHGVNATGKDNLDIVRVAESFAQIGFNVIVPDLTRMKQQSVSRQDIDDVLAVAETIPGKFGMVCISYGCGPTLVAAADDAVRDRVPFVVTFAGYFDMVAELRFMVTSPDNPLGYDKWRYAAANATLIGNDSERYWDMFRAGTAEEFDRRFADLPPEVAARIRAISPSGALPRLKARLIIVHGHDDPCIPLSQSMDLAAAAESLGIQHQLFVFSIYGHTQPQWPPLTWQTLKSTYVPEGLKMLRLANLVLSQR
jgi:pimeloyl-ACP methyl ester carboxylesterase